MEMLDVYHFGDAQEHGYDADKPTQGESKTPTITVFCTANSDPSTTLPG